MRKLTFVLTMFSACHFALGFPLEGKGQKNKNLDIDDLNIDIKMVHKNEHQPNQETLTDEEILESLAELLSLLGDNTSFPNFSADSEDGFGLMLDEAFASLILEDILINSFSDVSTEEKSNSTDQLKPVNGQSTNHITSESSPMFVAPQLQFLEPDLGPIVLPLHVPPGYFVPFIPRQAFGVDNGVARPAHGHASFYKYRPRGLVDVRNSPAFGYLLAGP